MSADNGIYILQTKDGWRITHAQCIENLYWWIDKKDYEKIDYGTCHKQKEEINPSVLYSFFKHSPIYKDQAEAWHYAMIEYRKYTEVEYGIQFIRGWEEKEFPKQCCDKPELIIVDDEVRCYNCGEWE